MPPITKSMQTGGKKKVKKKKDHTQSWYRLKAVEIAKLIAKERDKYTCQKCGATKDSGYQIHGSHIFSEGAHRTLSADPDNIKALCAKCHSPTFKGSWHEDPANQQWFDIKFPGRKERLLKKERELLGTQDWKKVLQELKEFYKSIISKYQ